VQRAGNVVPWKFSLFLSGFTSVSPKNCDVKDPTQVERLFLRPSTRAFDFPKRSLPCWSPAFYRPGKTRKNGNVSSLSALVYDFDSPKVVPGVVAKQLRKDGHAFALYTTWSHTKANPRFRVVLFLDRPILPHEFPRVWENGLSLIRYVDGVDRQCRDIARHYALPVRRLGAEEYVGELDVSGKPLSVDKLASLTSGKGEKEESVLTPETVLVLSTGGSTSVEDMLEKPPGKYRCTCPFQTDASPGSAFFRLMDDGRAFVRCTSERHSHDGEQFWLKKNGGETKKKRSAARSVEARNKLLTEIPDELLDYAERKLVYSCLQGVFYRRERGTWQISLPWQKQHLVDHLVGRLPIGTDVRHANALVDHILSRQAYGFDCSATAGAIIWSDKGRMINLYSKPNFTPVNGEWPRIKEIARVLTRNNPASIKWLVHWSAALVQYPERRSMVAVISISPHQGIGKSMYGRILSDMIGPGNVAVVSNRALRDKFNSSYVTSLLVLADEVGIDPRMTDVVSELKGYITDEEIHCATPYAARIKVQNRMSWWMTSNNRRPLILDENDRRITVLAADDPTREYRTMLRRCFDAKRGTFEPIFRDEISSYAHYLRSLKIDWKLIARPLRTKAREQIQSASLSSIDAFIEDIKKLGTLSILETYKPRMGVRISESVLQNCIPCERLYGSFREWCESHGYNPIPSEAELGLAVISLPGVEKTNARIAGNRIRAYVGLTKRQQPSGQVVDFPVN
jgi:hypothetical protein